MTIRIIVTVIKILTIKYTIKKVTKINEKEDIKQFIEITNKLKILVTLIGLYETWP